MSAVSKTEQALLTRHMILRERWSEAYADVETADGAFTWNEAEGRAIPNARGRRLEAKRDKAGERLMVVAEKLRERGYELRHFDSVPLKPGQDRW